MPAVSSSLGKASKSKPAPIVGTPDEDSELADQLGTAVRPKKKGRNATSRQKEQTNGTEEAYSEEVTRGTTPSPSRPQSILGQIPFASSFSRNHASADVLDVLGETVKVSDPYTSRTDAWAQDVPYGKSPPGNSVVGETIGESPPVQAAYLGRGGFSSKTPPRSPAQRKARPVSFGSTIPPMPVRPVSGEYAYRYTPSNYGSPPVPPHLPQQHFYSAHEVDIGLPQRQQSKTEIPNTFMAFRDLPSGRSRRGVFIGSQGRLDILAASADGKYEPVGALHNLSGNVLDAIMLSWESGNDPFAQLRPLVAITVHGVQQEHEIAITDRESIATGLHGANIDDGGIPQYETRVEVYSLQQKSRVTTLLSVPAVTFQSLSHYNAVPEPVGDIRLHAKGDHLVVSFGSSGEVFVYGVRAEDLTPTFECTAKFWTSVQVRDQSRDSSHSRSPRFTIVDAGLNGSLQEAAILSLSGRWLAICPPGSAHRPSVFALVARAEKARSSISIDSRSAPAKPSTTCGVESPDVETLLGKMARGVAQEVVKGAKWVGDQGLQAWNNYWVREQQQQPQIPPPNSAHLYSYRQITKPGMFPPTHASETVSREPDVVSIIDLTNLTIVAAFQPPGGCGFLSFTPNGLGLLTASKKGDVQYVWDLMQMKHLRSAALMTEAPTNETTTPRVRQLAKFERLTPSTIVDVVWEPFLGERLALLTKNGTVHIFDLPVSAFRWPPPRRPGRFRTVTAISNPTSPTGDQDLPPVTGFFASAKNIASKTQPLFANLRGRAPSLGQGFSGIGTTGVGIASATGARSGRAVAAGLSKSLGAASGTVQNLRHAGETRLHVGSLVHKPATAMITWNKRGGKAILSVIDERVVKSYYISKVQSRDKNNRITYTSVFAKKAISHKLPSLSSLIKYGILADTQAGEEGAHQVDGHWTVDSPRRAVQSARMSHPLSHAEIESNAPYQPFHSDPCVNLFTYSDETGMGESQLPTASAIFGGPFDVAKPARAHTDRWVFGEPMSTTRLDMRSSSSANRGDDSVIYRETSATTILDSGDMPEQIVSTTRRKKTKNPGRSMLTTGEDFGNEHDGFFEDDCDVLDFAGDRV